MRNIASAVRYKDALSRMATGELDELRALFASPSSSSAGSPPRETALPLTRIAKFGVADENRKLAEVGRMQKEERRQTREMEEAMRIEKARASKAKAVAIQERARLHKDMTQQPHMRGDCDAAAAAHLCTRRHDHHTRRLGG